MASKLKETIKKLVAELERISSELESEIRSEWEGTGCLNMRLSVLKKTERLLDRVKKEIL